MGEARLTPAVADRVDELARLRRDFHRHPELGFEETRTAAVVAERLGAAGLEVTTGVAKTGVVGLLRGARPGKTLLVRADMDALPLSEEREGPYRSQAAGKMHACGHDGHVAMALVAAEVLADMRERLAGNVKFCFQPAEEGPGGAEPMIAAGVLREPAVDAAVGIHLWTGLDVGVVGITDGPTMAATDHFELVIEGIGGHGAYPHETVDPVVVAAHVVVALQTIVSRRISPLDPAVVTVGTLETGHRFNIIPREARLSGTLRCYRDEVRAELARQVEGIAAGIASALGARARFELHRGYPATVNDPEMGNFVREQAAAIVAPSAVIEPPPSMASEDMSYFLNAVPGTFIFLGGRNPDRGLDAPHHSSLFDFDEAALPIGADLFVKTALSYLRP